MVRKTRKKQKPKFEEVPKEFHTVTPYLAINGAAQTVTWYKDVFGELV